jgi:hypothetical protein
METKTRPRLRPRPKLRQRSKPRPRPRPRPRPGRGGRGFRRGCVRNVKIAFLYMIKHVKILSYKVTLLHFMYDIYMPYLG